MRLLRFDKFVVESSSQVEAQDAQAQQAQKQETRKPARSGARRPRKAVKVPGWKTY